MLVLRYSSPAQKERHYDTFLAGLVGGYAVFGRGIQSSVNQQIVIYVFARVVLALAKLAILPQGEGRVAGGGGGYGLIRDEKLRERIRDNAWTVFASLSWAAVMYVFRWHPETVQPSLRSSMNYMWVLMLISPIWLWMLTRYRYVNADHWDSLKTLLWHNK